MSSQETPVNDAEQAALAARVQVEQVEQDVLDKRVKQAVSYLLNSVLDKTGRLLAAKLQECPSFSEGVPGNLRPENFQRVLLTFMTYERAGQIAATNPPLREEQVQALENIAEDLRTRLVEVGGNAAKEGEQASTRHE